MATRCTEASCRMPSQSCARFDHFLRSTASQRRGGLRLLRRCAWSATTGPPVRRRAGGAPHVALSHDSRFASLAIAGLLVSCSELCVAGRGIHLQEPSGAETLSGCTQAAHFDHRKPDSSRPAPHTAHETRRHRAPAAEHRGPLRRGRGHRSRSGDRRPSGGRSAAGFSRSTVSLRRAPPYALPCAALHPATRCSSVCAHFLLVRGGAAAR